MHACNSIEDKIFLKRIIKKELSKYYIGKLMQASLQRHYYYSFI